MKIGSESLAGVDDGVGRLEPATMAQPPTTADGDSGTDPRPALEDAAIVIHPDGYELIEVGDTEPTESEAVQQRIDELPEEPGGAAFNADAHPDHSSVELVDTTYSFDVAATLRLAHVESGRFDVLGDDQLVRCVNPEYDYLTWFYEAGDDDGMVAEYHEIDDFEAGTIERSKALASIASPKVEVSVVDRETLEERRERGEALTDGGEEVDEPREYTLLAGFHDHEPASRSDEEFSVTARSEEEAKAKAREESEYDIQFFTHVAPTFDGGSSEADDVDDQEYNDDWSGTNLTWGEAFLLKIEAEGRESVGEIGLLVADKAALNHLQNTSGFRPPHDGKPSSWSLMDETEATFETEHASLTADLYSDTHTDEDAEAVFSMIEDALDDASRLDQIRVTVDEEWNRVSEGDDV